MSSGVPPQAVVLVVLLVLSFVPVPVLVWWLFRLRTRTQPVRRAWARGLLLACVVMAAGYATASRFSWQSLATIAGILLIASIGWLGWKRKTRWLRAAGWSMGLVLIGCGVLGGFTAWSLLGGANHGLGWLAGILLGLMWAAAWLVVAMGVACLVLVQKKLATRTAVRDAVADPLASSPK